MSRKLVRLADGRVGEKLDRTSRLGSRRNPLSLDDVRLPQCRGNYRPDALVDIGILDRADGSQLLAEVSRIVADDKYTSPAKYRRYSRMFFPLDGSLPVRRVLSTRILPDMEIAGGREVRSSFTGNYRSETPNNVPLPPDGTIREERLAQIQRAQALKAEVARWKLATLRIIEALTESLFVVK